MSQYLRLINSLLVTLGGTASPEAFPLEEAFEPEGKPPSRFEVKKGKITFTPAAFTFFQGMLSRSYIIGHIPNPDGHSFPIVLAINASSILVRDGGSLKPYIQPVIRETVLLPSKIPYGEDEVAQYHEYGLDMDRYEISDVTYRGIRSSAAKKVLDILDDVKETVYLTFAKAISDDSYMVLVDGSLKPTKDVVAHGNWVGLHPNPQLSAEEETVSLKLTENEIGLPFKLQGNGKGYFWHLRMLSDMRKGPEWGIVRVDNSLADGEDMPSKIESISAAILSEKYPIHPAIKTAGWGLYPLITARIYLNTQTTSDTTIMKYF